MPLKVFIVFLAEGLTDGEMSNVLIFRCFHNGILTKSADDDGFIERFCHNTNSR